MTRTGNGREKKKNMIETKSLQTDDLGDVYTVERLRSLF